MPAVRHERRVLIVDDDVDSAEMLAEAASIHGCAFEVAHDGPTAVDAAKRYRPHVVILDLELPGMSGYEVARQLRKEVELAPLKLIALTGHGREADREKTREAGFDAHVVKPIEINDLPKLLGITP
jgi:CheY-like chemotaxis protein